MLKLFFIHILGYITVLLASVILTDKWITDKKALAISYLITLIAMFIFHPIES